MLKDWNKMLPNSSFLLFLRDLWVYGSQAQAEASRDSGPLFAKVLSPLGFSLLVWNMKNIKKHFKHPVSACHGQPGDWSASSKADVESNISRTEYFPASLHIKMDWGLQEGLFHGTRSVKVRAKMIKNPKVIYCKSFPNHICRYICCSFFLLIGWERVGKKRVDFVFLCHFLIG